VGVVSALIGDRDDIMADEAQPATLEIKRAVDLGASVVGGAAGSVAGFAVGGPIGAVLGGALGPAIQAVLGEMLTRQVTNRERARMGGLVIAAQERYIANLAQGLQPNEGFDPNSPDGHELLEGALQKARTCYRERKLRLLGNIYGNYPFVKGMPVDDAHLMLELIEGLSYRQVVVLATIARGLPPLRTHDYREGRRSRMGVIALLQEIYDLSQRGLIICQAPNAGTYDFLTAWHDIVPAHLRLAPLGDALARIAGLDSISPDDSREIAEALRD
jgi:hypothetical protein